jgi:hypothetical protein
MQISQINNETTQTAREIAVTAILAAGYVEANNCHADSPIHRYVRKIAGVKYGTSIVLTDRNINFFSNSPRDHIGCPLSMFSPEHKLTDLEKDLLKEMGL